MSQNLQSWKRKRRKKPKLIEKPKTKPALRFTKALSQEVGVSEISEISIMKELVPNPNFNI